MKILILAVALILVLGIFGGVIAVSGSSDDSGLIPEVNDDDVVEAERSAEEYLRQQAGDILVSAYPIVEYSTGWYESSDGRADVISMVVVRKEGTSGSGNQMRISVHGKVHIGGSPFKIIATERNDNRVVYSLIGNKESGKMTLEKVKTYNGGISRWDGTLALQYSDGAKELSANVQLMAREKIVDEKKIKTYQGGQTKFVYSGNLNFGDWVFKFASEKSDAKKINAKVRSESVQGNMELELVSENNGVRIYEGKLKAEDRIDGRDSFEEKNKISAVLRVEVRYNDNAWVGPLKATLKNGQVLEGEMVLTELKFSGTAPVTDVPKDVRGRDWTDDRGFDVDERSGRSSDDSSDDSFDDSRDSFDDSSDDSFDDDSNSKKKGFWKKFVRAFGFKDSE